MKAYRVNSSNLALVGYDAKRLILSIEFVGSEGKRYEYAGVGPEIHEALVGAQSPGSYFSINVKGRFNCTQIEPFALLTACKGCGCGDEDACPGGCEWEWVDRDLDAGLCSRCVAENAGEEDTALERRADRMAAPGAFRKRTARKIAIGKSRRA